MGNQNSSAFDNLENINFEKLQELGAIKNLVKKQVYSKNGFIKKKCFQKLIFLKASFLNSN